jgi:hypothetical protein
MRSAAKIAGAFDKPRRDGRNWRFACPLCGGHGWAREYEGETKVGCWGCGDWKGLRRLAFGAQKPPPRSAKPKDAPVDPEAEPIDDPIVATYLMYRGLDPAHCDIADHDWAMHRAFKKVLGR